MSGTQKTSDANVPLNFRRYRDGDASVDDFRGRIFQAGHSHKCPTYVQSTPPCQGSCPSGEDIRGYLAIVRQTEKPPAGMAWQEYASRRLTAANPFPSVMGRVCPAPCETGCNRNEVEDHFGINSFEHLLGEYAIANKLAYDKPEKRSGKKIAVLGGGPVGLSSRGRQISKKDKEELPKAKLTLANLKKSLRLFTYLGPHKWKFVLGMFFLFGTAGVGLYFLLISGKMFGYFGQTGKSVEEMNTELIDIGQMLLLILVVQGVFSFGRVFMFAQVTESILKGLRTDSFKRIIQMPMEFFSQNQVAELSSRIATDINVVSDAFTVNIAELIRQSIVGFQCLIRVKIKNKKIDSISKPPFFTEGGFLLD